MPQSTYEILGQKTEELARLNAEYDNLLSVVASIRSGMIDISRVTVDLEKRSWRVAPDLGGSLSIEPSANGYEEAHEAKMADKGDFGIPPGSRFGNPPAEPPEPGNEL